MGTVSAQTSVNKRMRTRHQPSGNSMLVKAESQNIRNHKKQKLNDRHVEKHYILFFSYVQNFRFALTIASLSLRPLDEGPQSSIFAKGKEE